MERSEGTKKASDSDLLKALLDGRAKMPSFKGKISDDEATKLIQYLRTFKK
ncbi:MAG: cytochrome c [Deltaproteobacteria bacterium]|nr:cytochrome c [Deltaproteobacteria bacterium]